MKARRPDTRLAEATALVAERSGMVFAPNRQVEAAAGFARAMKRAGAADTEAYLTELRLRGTALDGLVDELTVGETHFLRDPAQMDLLRRDVLPALARRGGPHAPVRAWSAGCATGEEAYTLAILMEEALLGDRASVLGTDLSATALRKARAGSYSSWSMRGVPDAFLQAWFHLRGGRRVIFEGLRRRVRFEQLNLMDGGSYAAAGAVGLDLILCRNVLIYFNAATTAAIAGLLFKSLAEGGVLLTAGADPMLASLAPFETEVTRAGLIYRRPRPTMSVAVPAPPVHPPPVVAARSVTARAEPDVVRPSPPGPPDPAASFAEVVVAANRHGVEAAEHAARDALLVHPLDGPLHHLRATLLLALGRDAEAETSALRALYLDRSLAVAHFLFGTIVKRRGDTAAARRAFRNVRELCASRPADELVPSGEGASASALAAAAGAEIELLGAER